MMMASVKRRAEDSAVVERLDSDTPGPSWTILVTTSAHPEALGS